MFPALIITALASLLLGNLLFTPTHFARLGTAAVFTTFSLSNMFFRQEAGYFDTSATFKPLLHTWPLSVEEQFYLVWPALLVVLARVNILTRNIALVAIGVLSLYLAERFLGIDPAAAYFWVPFRIFEFSIEAMLVFLNVDRPGKASLEEVLFALGLVLAVAPAFVYSPETPFSGLYAAIPCVGAAILIYSGRAGLLGGVLRNRFAVGIGLISYSLYLVHWFIIVVYRYWKLGGLGPKSQILLLFATFIAASFMYFPVEKKFRYPSQGKHKRTSISFGLSFLLVALVAVSLGAGIWSGKGWPWRYSGSELALIDSVNDIEEKRQRTSDYGADAPEVGFSYSGDPLYLIIGDSFSKGVFNALKMIKPDINQRRLQIKAMCQPVIPAAR